MLGTSIEFLAKSARPLDEEDRREANSIIADAARIFRISKPILEETQLFRRRYRNVAAHSDETQDFYEWAPLWFLHPGVTIFSVWFRASTGLDLYESFEESRTQLGAIFKKAQAHCRRLELSGARNERTRRLDNFSAGSFEFGFLPLDVQILFRSLVLHALDSGRNPLYAFEYAGFSTEIGEVLYQREGFDSVSGLGDFLSEMCSTKDSSAEIELSSVSWAECPVFLCQSPVFVVWDHEPHEDVATHTPRRYFDSIGCPKCGLLISRREEVLAFQSRYVDADAMAKLPRVEK